MLYDGLCGFCDVTARLLLRVLRFAPLQGPFAAHALAHLPTLFDDDVLVLVEPDAREAPRVTFGPNRLGV